LSCRTAVETVVGMDLMRRIRRFESGQASVELVAALPFVLLIGALIWQ